jgi:D-alanyl-lipoteichoic acid acyltransferase DltB (MBOAT superfamily)
MLFNSYEYLIYFLPLTLAGYFLINRRSRYGVQWLVAASLFFYAWWRPAHLPVIAASIAFNFWISHSLHRAMQRRGPDAVKRLLRCGVAGNLVLLGVFKYADFVLENVAAVAGRPASLLHLALPLGISFFTFTQIAYLVDVSRGKAREPSGSNYALFVTFFPHLLAGPILHHSEMMPQFASRWNKLPRPENLALGLFLLTIGLAKKLFADQFAPTVNDAFSHPATLDFAAAWTAALAYTLQLYFDFSGYTDMALGSAWLFNIRLPLNFNSPYRATDIREFWQRWHMTLMRFLRDYVYAALRGRRRSELRVVVALFLTFVLGGIWHGAGWTFVVWGALHGLALVVERYWGRLGVPLPAALGWFLTLGFFVSTLMIFRASSLGDGWSMLSAMAGRHGDALSSLSAAGLGWWAQVLASPSLWKSALSLPALIVVGFAIVLWPVNSNQLAARFHPTIFNAILVASSLTWCILHLSQVTQFIYFNF